jgi:hypothetical protein
MVAEEVVAKLMVHLVAVQVVVVLKVHLEPRVYQVRETGVVIEAVKVAMAQRVVAVRVALDRIQLRLTLVAVVVQVLLCLDSMLVAVAAEVAVEVQLLLVAQAVEGEEATAEILEVA